VRALDGLRDRYELVVIEGAGSAAEPNLRATDIVNMRVARHAEAVTLVVGDIDRGGVFAHLLGTVELMSPEDRALIQGFIINRFRGDPSLLTPAIEELERRTGIPVVGVIPWLNQLRLAEEDAVALERVDRATGNEGASSDIDIAVIHLGRIANFDDFDPLVDEPGVRLRYVSQPSQLDTPDLVVLPGTKATIADLEQLQRSGLARAIAEHHAAGGSVLGICGGYQMLGERIEDPKGVEARRGTSVPGLGLLPVTTTFVADKSTRLATGRALASAGPWSGTSGATVEGYEIHMGRTEPAPGTAPFLELDGHEDGAISLDGRAAGTYLHGLLHTDALRSALLAGLGRPEGIAGASFDREREFDRLAHHVRSHLDMDRIRGWLGLHATR
jgi:adenosylcobyric acid synthase